MRDMVPMPQKAWGVWYVGGGYLVSLWLPVVPA